MPMRSIVRTSSSLGLAAAVLAGPAAAQAPGGPPPKVTTAKPVVREIVETDTYTGRFDPRGHRRCPRPRHRLPRQAQLPGRRHREEGRPALRHRRRPYKAALDQAQAALVSARARLNFSQTDLDRRPDPEQVGQHLRAGHRPAPAGLADGPGRCRHSADAQLRQAQLNYDFTEVRAPISGRISRRLVTEGNIVITDQTLLTTIVSLDPIYFGSPSMSARS